MEKSKKDSWVDIATGNENFLGRKTVDKSTFKYGTTIPLRYHKVFLDNLSDKLSFGKSIKVKLFINKKEFTAMALWPSSKGRNGMTVQLRYSNKALLEILKEKLEVSYDYIVQYEKENDKKPTTIPEEYQEYIDFYKGDKIDTFVLELIPKSKSIPEDEEIDDEEIIEDEIDNEFDAVNNINDEVTYIHKYITSKGFYYTKDLITNFYLSLKTKPFVILSGISGTGKSKIVELFAQAVGANLDNQRFNDISEGKHSTFKNGSYML
ncbi:hypothetical protein KTC96_06575 [Clostridium estertheticum]|uniref:hypothetical protein n=1 Tax=Clostridium estertheticum TaxID=238834 RepID=UPI001C7DBEAA|nr:hypothetical protein [Clostridium estertheticum]MBX4261300.1 hypothetical protein [Clostridium estertheticum]WLC71661.1 hypothetical protein KTC96_06575 [Clostridium estertheticum]